MPVYKFIVRDSINRVNGAGHSGAALDDDIDATLFAAGMIQRLSAERHVIPECWVVEIVRDQEQVGMLSFADGRRVVLDPHRNCEGADVEIRGGRIDLIEC